MFAFDENDGGMNNVRDVSSKKKTKEDQPAETVVQSKPKTRSLITVEELNLSKEHKYSAMAIYQLMKVLIDPNMRDHH